MLKSHILLLLLFSFSSSLFSQQADIVYYETFDDNSNRWETFSNKSEFARISDGTYTIKSSEKNALRWFGLQNFIDYRKNFRIEAKMKQTKGSENQGYGIVWGSIGWEDSFEFIITSSGYYSIGGYKKSKYFAIKEWTKSSKINSLGRYNIIAIEKDGINLNFFINNEQVHTCRFKKFNGQIHGFILKSNITAVVDYYKITTEPRTIDVANTIFSDKVKENIGATINSEYSEIAPIISPDGKILYFGRIKNIFKHDECDIWYSELQPDSTWGEAKNIGKPLNNSGVNVVITQTPDGNALLVEGLYNSDGSHKSEQGISISYKTNNGWSVPQEVKIKNFYNDNIYETYCLSNNRKVIILSIERDDTYGDLDLYVSFLQQDGSYSEPKNMGPVINTFTQDGTPFLASDDKTLYFSSAGHHGYGSEDIYVTKRLDDTWLRWSKPKNLGANINTFQWDTYLSISAKADYAYLVSTSGSIGNEDIFTLELEKEQQPDPVVLIYGTVYDENTKKPLGAKITYQDLSTGEEAGIAISNSYSGKYKITLPYGKLYGFRAEAKDYIAENENINLKTKSGYIEIKRDLYLFPMKVGEIIVLNNVFFPAASFELLETSHPELDRIIEIMTKNPTIEIELIGHTDNRGNKDELQALSENRVNAVKDYFVENGIDENRITTKAFGGTQPIAEDNSEAEHAKNRRVEFKIVKM